ncbi:TM2 domain-containing protein [Paenalcaligenes niemegkensis]|uniref:TM2 domain-containing protein n=1 Tax=Paenalcaligenes niemegkensis TaxID=2895469 RepID=UPI001EE99987|nr:TM2 domain-containing protein [Paenalcaligenes niemegkensis]MCQ9615965.1 TM2 domain-containing protein [Paenalcaligenes niemegkensis]
MLQKIVLAIAVFLVILLALSFGETAFSTFFAWISWISGAAIESFSDVYQRVADYVQASPVKVVIALLLTIPISYWISRRQQGNATPSTSKRKVTIFLAVFLGWIGIHRFYIGQYFWGLLYILLFMVFAPISILLALIDAVRYITMNDDEFDLLYR